MVLQRPRYCGENGLRYLISSTYRRAERGRQTSNNHHCTTRALRGGCTIGVVAFHHRSETLEFAKFEAEETGQIMRRKIISRNSDPGSGSWRGTEHGNGFGGITRRALLQMMGGAVCASSFGAAQAAGSENTGDPFAWLVPQHWVKQRTKPVIALGKSGEFDDMHLFAPCVGREEGRYYLWYSGSRGRVPERVYRLGLATSQDAIEFEKNPGGPVFEFGDGRTSVSTPCVLRQTDGTLIREHGKLRMWFAGQELTRRGGTTTLYGVTGTAPDRWDKPSAPLLRNCYAPSVIKEGSVYRLWFTDVSVRPWKYRHAMSDDGMRWSVTPQPVMVIDQGWEASILAYPQVVRAGGLYLMWYGTYWWSDEDAVRWPKTAIGFAASRDGLEWHKYPGNPVLRPAADLPWETHYNTSQSVIRLADGSWRIWYAARKKPPEDRALWNKYFSIGTATWEGLR